MHQPSYDTEPAGMVYSTGDSHAHEIIGRFAPSPSGRMHMGNVYAALISWLSVKSRNGKWILRIEDLDPQRSKIEYARLIEDDLHWLGLEWDMGGLDDTGTGAPYRQSLRHGKYHNALQTLSGMGLTYTCHCRRADIMATQAPHQSDGRIVYAGTCRPAAIPPFVTGTHDDADHGAIRLYVPDRDIDFEDKIYGCQRVNLARHCGDFVLRRADGAWAYQLAVVVDDALMGVNEVVRGNDLLLSSAQQIYIYNLLGYTPPTWAHIPLMVNGGGQRLSKRDGDMSLEHLRRGHSPQEIIGHIAYTAGLIEAPAPCRPADLVTVFDMRNISHDASVKAPDMTGL